MRWLKSAKKPVWTLNKVISTAPKSTTKTVRQVPVRWASSVWAWAVASIRRNNTASKKWQKLTRK